jgi:DNA-binding NtrC family response regulator
MDNKKRVLWIEDEIDTDPCRRIDNALTEHFTFCGDSHAHTLSSGLLYLLEATRGYREAHPFPDLILLDYKLDKDAMLEENQKQIDKLAGEDQKLRESVSQCLNGQLGSSVLSFLAQHMPKVPIVLVSKYPEDLMQEIKRSGVLRNNPGLLSGYYSKINSTEQFLTKMLFDILDDPRRGLSIIEIRKKLPETSADFLLGPVGRYEWSDAYRRALTDLVRAGEEKAQCFDFKDKGNPYIPQSDNERFRQCLKSHKGLPRALILGEKGTGKEGFASALHSMWYAGKIDVPPPPFVPINLGGVPSWSAGLALPLRMFAAQAHKDGEWSYGCVPNAWNGTLFMDEIGDARKEVQDTLLRLIQEGEYEASGWETRQIWAAHCCFIGATNRALWGSKDFREDVSDRLAMYVIKLPSLNEVPQDMSCWMDKISRLVSEHSGINREFEFDEAAANIFTSYSWPGNLRELTHTIRRMHFRAKEMNATRIPLGIVTDEISRLKRIHLAVTGLSISHLPMTKGEWNIFLDGAVQYFENSDKKHVSKQSVCKYTVELLGRPIALQSLMQHFDNTFGPSAFDRMLSDISMSSGIPIWGASST